MGAHPSGTYSKMIRTVSDSNLDVPAQAGIGNDIYVVYELHAFGGAFPPYHLGCQGCLPKQSQMIPVAASIFDSSQHDKNYRKGL